MKIKVKSFNDLVRFQPSITFMRLRKRTGTLKSVRRFLDAAFAGNSDARENFLNL